MQNPDNTVYLAQGRAAAEFNIVGDCCGTKAIFNSGAFIVVRTSVNNGSSSAAQCLAGGFTGETNNLYFNPAVSAPTSEALSAVVFTQSSASSSTSPCTYASDLAANKAATDDFNGKGHSDILWRNSNGDVAMWFMNGTQVLANPDLGNVSGGWSIAGTGDFNGDGKSDILWRNTNGDVAIWLMNGTQVLANPDLGNVGTSWSIAGTGDFNGDGFGDILWRNTNGDVAIWLMNGTQVLANPDLGNVGTSWSHCRNRRLQRRRKDRHPVAQLQWRCRDLAHERCPSPGES